LVEGGLICAKGALSEIDKEIDELVAEFIQTVIVCRAG
jgi:hypothetical protein